MNDETLALTRFIEEQALALGFDKVGFLPATTFPEDAERLSAWLAEGYHADMAWMATHEALRTNVQLLHPEAQSIVVVAINYAPPKDATAELDIAKYAWGKDYHKVIRKKLATLLETLQQRDPRIQGRPFSDSAPLMEKSMAVKAGIGWQGKNSLVITKELGSYVFLGEMVLNVPLDYSGSQAAALALQETDPCGRCQRCLDACPTEAFVAPRVLDSRRCISYWTIENHDAQLPEDIALQKEDWIFGCDVCQDVCPWNLKFSQPSTEPAFQPRDLITRLTRDALLAMTQAEFDAHFTATPLRRTGLSNLQRNLRQPQ